MKRDLSFLQRVAPWAVRGGAALLLLGAHLWIFRPARSPLARHVAYPLLAAAAPEQAAVRLVGGGQTVRVALPRGEGATFKPPPGVRFLFPALFLLVAFPRRFYWAGLGGLHLAAGAIALLVLAASIRWGGLGVYRFWQATGRDLFSLLVPLWMWLHAREGRFLPGSDEAKPEK